MDTTDHKPIEVLLVEDNPDDAFLIQAMLSEPEYGADWRVTHVSRLWQGIERLQRDRFDVVLLDLGLPDSQGIETFRLLSAQTADTPIVVLSGYDDEFSAVEAVRAGAQDYLVKGRTEGDVLARAIRYDRTPQCRAARRARREPAHRP